MGHTYEKTGHKEFFTNGFMPDVVVTAGGTQEKVDDVRYIGNFSTGEFGASLAHSYYELGYNVLLLATAEAQSRLMHDPLYYKAWSYKKVEEPDEVIESRIRETMRLWELDSPSQTGIITHVNENQHHLECHTFKSAKGLRKKLLAVPAAKLVLHAAAVADYSPERVRGKISSDQDELTIHLKRNPKILSELRGHFGKNADIVGFKLLSDVSEEELVATALRQIADNKTDYCVANDLTQRNIDGSGRFGKNRERRVHIVTKDGSYQTMQDTTLGVARSIAKTIVPGKSTKQ